jgi:protein SCO1/2
MRFARRQPAPLPRLGAIPTFAMHDQRAREITDGTLRGAVSVVDFFFTSCPVSCPRLTSRLADVERRLAARHPDRAAFPARLVSISVDPENDTPARLAEYARKYGANDDRWWFLTGDAASLSAVVVQGFKVDYRKADPDLGIGDIMHGNWFVLVDVGGQIRGYYLSDEASRVDDLVADVERLVHEGA